MYFDLYHPYPIAEDPSENSSNKKKKGKGKAVPAAAAAHVESLATGNKKDCWNGLDSIEKEKFARRLALAGHLGYSVVGCTISQPDSSTNTNHAYQSPFTSSMPFPQLDPRFSSSSSSSSSTNDTGISPKTGTVTSDRPAMVQVTRFHIKLNDNKSHCLTNQNTTILREYDILSVAPTSDKAFQLACTDMSNPGPNQVSIITLPLHERPFSFRFNRKQMRQAQRNGVVFELLYSAALFPPPSLNQDIARKYRQNFLSNAREVVRITGGTNIIFSSGPGGSDIGLRGPIDLVNLGTMLGMPANLAKESVEKAPKMVLLRSQARKTFKAIMSIPKLVPPPGELDSEPDRQDVSILSHQDQVTNGNENDELNKSSGGVGSKRVHNNRNQNQGSIDGSISKKAKSRKD